MLSTDQIKVSLELLLSKKRFAHSINVMETSALLAKIYGQDTRSAELAGLLHDCARNLKGKEIFEICEKYNIAMDDIFQKQPELLHGPIGAKLAEELYGVTEKQILDAISNHTLGDENMSILEKIVFVADYIEPGREFKGVDEIRKAAQIDLDKAVLMGFDCTLEYCLKKGSLIHPKAIFARNYVLKSLNNCDRIV